MNIDTVKRFVEGGTRAQLEIDKLVNACTGRIIAEFTSAKDARLFAGLKREQGEQVTVTPGVNHLFAVRVLVRSI